MRPDINDILSYEIKQEIAGRYFGFRKLIEEDTLSYENKLRQHTEILEKRISFDLIRIYILLRNQTLIHRFLALVGLEETYFYDPYLAESANIRKRVFEGVRLRGITQKGCFKNTIEDCYERLVEHIEHYREQYADLALHQETISEEIRLFYQKNDLSSILGFLRSLESHHSLETNILNGVSNNLDHELQLVPPPPINEIQPTLPPLPPLASIRRELHKIISLAFQLQRINVYAYLSKKGQFFQRRGN